LDSTRAIPATVASAISAAHCVERRVQGEKYIIKRFRPSRNNIKPHV
jgi:hypothetical protein